MKNEAVFLKNTNNKLIRVSELSDADYVRISKEQYYGFLNALRIINDRSLQEIERSKADSHGYTLKICEERIYSRLNPSQRAYYIAKTTPISLKIDLDTACFIIFNDLRNHYNFLSLKDILDEDRFGPEELLMSMTQKKNEEYNYPFYVENSDFGQRIKKIIDTLPEAIAFEVVRINANIGQGVYEVSYWATAPI